nr:pentatricopeptide repeat-containing protein [Quercus suber]
MVTLSRKFSITAIPNSSKLLQRYPQSTTTTHIFIPFSQLQQRKLFESHLISVLHGCTHLTQIKQVHAHILRKGLDQCCYVLTKLIRMLTKIDVPVHSYPRLVFHQVKYPNPFLWTALIRGYATQGPFSESVVLYNRMRSEGTGPVSFTFSALFKACVAVLDVGLGRQTVADELRPSLIKLNGDDSAHRCDDSGPLRRFWSPIVGDDSLAVGDASSFNRSEHKPSEPFATIHNRHFAFLCIGDTLPSLRAGDASLPLLASDGSFSLSLCAINVYELGLCQGHHLRLRSKEPFLKVLLLHKQMISKQRKFLLVGFQLQSVKLSFSFVAEEIVRNKISYWWLLGDLLLALLEDI